MKLLSMNFLKDLARGIFTKISLAIVSQRPTVPVFHSTYICISDVVIFVRWFMFFPCSFCIFRLVLYQKSHKEKNEGRREGSVKSFHSAFWLSEMVLLYTRDFHTFFFVHKSQLGALLKCRILIHLVILLF